MRKHAVYAGVAALLLRMAAAWAGAATAALRAAAATGGSADRQSSSLTTAARLTAALRLLVHAAAHFIDQDTLVPLSDEVQALCEGLSGLAEHLRPDFLSDTATPPPQCAAELRRLPEVQLVAGCQAFAAWFVDDEPQLHTSAGGDTVAHAHAAEGKARKQDVQHRLFAARFAGLSTDCAALAERLRRVRWHADTSACGDSLLGTSWRLLHIACGERAGVAGESAPAQDTIPQPPATDRPASVQSDDLDEVLLEAGHGWAGQHRSVRDRSGADPANLARDTFAAPQLPREHASLAEELHLPSSLHLGARTSMEGCACVRRDRGPGTGVGASQGSISMQRLSFADGGEGRAQIVSAAVGQGLESVPLRSVAHNAGGHSADPAASWPGGPHRRGDETAHARHDVEIMSDSSDIAADPYVKELREQEASAAVPRSCGNNPASDR